MPISRVIAVGILVLALIQPSLANAQVRYADLGITLIKLVNESGSTVVPRLGEPFRILVMVTNSGNTSAAAFTLRVNATVSNSNQNFSFSHSFALFNVGTTRQMFGPINVTVTGSTSANLTVTASVNVERSPQELDFSNNVLVQSFPIGDFFPNANRLDAPPLLEMSDQQTLTTKYDTYSNGLHVSLSSDGNVVALRSDAWHVVVYRNGSRVLDANLTSGDLEDFQLSRNGKYIAVTTYHAFYVLNVSSFQAGSITKTNDLAEVALSSGFDADLQMRGFSRVAISDDGKLALGGTPSSQGKINYISQIDVQFIQVLDWRSKTSLWTIDLFKENAPWTQGIWVWVESLSFDRNDNLLVTLRFLGWDGTTSMPVAVHRTNPWLYLIDPGGKTIWRGYLNVPPTLISISDDGNTIMVGSTEDGFMRVISRAPTGSNTSLYIGTNARSDEKPYSSQMAVALAPEGDYYALADPANIYLLTVQGKPIFKFGFPYATSLALGGGYLVAGHVGGAEVFSLWDPVDKSINQATSIINTAPVGVDMSEAKASLNSALSLRQHGLWYQSYEEALRTTTLADSLIAEAATRTTTTVSSSTLTQSSFSTSGQPLNLSSQTMILSIVTVFAVLAVVLYARTKRKK